MKNRQGSHHLLKHVGQIIVVDAEFIEQQVILETCLGAL